ncbi:MAG TPA: insulinase family protein, partial [Croceibacterium sp.]
AALAAPGFAQDAAPAAEAAPAGQTGVPAWDIASSELPADPAVRFGRLANGMRYAIRHHDKPEGGASVRFAVDVGAREEGDDEVGAAHFVEHMAFNGSTNIPEGELVARLERLGLAFGADTNATTSLEYTSYMLELPHADAPTVDAALAIMREVASELTIAPEAVERERGIILSEYQVRNAPQRRRIGHYLSAALPDSHVGARVTAPPAAINGITADELRAFYRGYYRPERATLAVVGDFDVAEVEAKIRAAFGDWQATGAARESYAPPVQPQATPRIASFVDPSIPEVVELQYVSPYQPPLNTIAGERRALLEIVATLALNNRLAALTRPADSPILQGQASIQELFRSAEAAGMLVVAKDGQWRGALAIAEQELRRAREHGFTAAEIGEAKTNLDAFLRNAAAQAPGRQSGALADELTGASLRNEVPDSPEAELALYRSLADSISPESVTEAFRAAWPGTPTLVHLSTKSAIDGGEAAIGAALAASGQVAVAAPAEAADKAFAYDDFGAPGAVVTDATVADLGIRTVAFANGTRLNLKRTDFEPGSVSFLMLVGDGLRAFPRDKAGLPLMLQVALPEDGLDAHDPDELRRLLAGRRVSLGLGAGEDGLVASGATTPADLELQLKLLAARLTATAYRPATQTQWAGIAPVLANNIAASPLNLLQIALDYEIGGDDGRLGLEDPAALSALTLQDLEAAIEPQLAAGAVEVALVGDFDEAAAIAAFARTLGALPPRPARGAWGGTPFAFTQDLAPRTIRHRGAADQGAVALSWPTTDGRDLRSTLTRDLLAAVIRVRLIEKLREELGATYSPNAGSDAPVAPDGFGNLTVLAPAAPDKAALVIATVREIAAEL